MITQKNVKAHSILGLSRWHWRLGTVAAGSQVYKTIWLPCSGVIVREIGFSFHDLASMDAVLGKVWSKAPGEDAEFDGITDYTLRFTGTSRTPGASDLKYVELPYKKIDGVKGAINGIPGVALTFEWEMGGSGNVTVVEIWALLRVLQDFEYGRPESSG